MMLMAKYSDLLGDGQRSSMNYFEQVRRAVGDIPLNIFSTINNQYTLDPASVEAHRSLEAELLSDSIRNKLRRIRQNTPTKPFVAFTRAGALLNLKLLLATSRPTAPYKPTAVGACALHANDFIESPNSGALSSGLLPVVTEFAATWEIQNPREIAPVLRRCYFIYDHLLKKDERIRKLVSDELGVEVEEVAFSGLPFRSYFPLLFGLYTVARNGVEKERTSIINAHDVAAKAGVTPGAFVAFAMSKARTLAVARSEFGLIETADDFKRKVEDSAWTSDVLSFRRKPLLALSDGRYIVLDIQFLFENASAGLSWNFMAAFDSAKATHAFLAYWGGVFERYTQEVLEHYFATSVRRGLQFNGGDIDVLLELPDAALAMEVKSGFIAQDVKGCRDEARFAAEIEKKYVVDQDGKPKGVRQLAASVRALREKRVAGVRTPFQRIYPILVAEDPVMQTFAMNAYLNQLFALEIDRGRDIAPLTVLLIDELEEILPYIAAGDLSWQQVLDARFVGDKVVAAPMHTTFSELHAELNLKSRGDTFLASHGDELISMIDDAYGGLT